MTPGSSFRLAGDALPNPPTPSFADYHCEAAAVSLTRNGHQSGCTLRVTGQWKENLVLDWETLDPSAEDTHADQRYCTEHGAYALALLVVHHYKPWQKLERSVQGTGFDFWLGYGSGPLFQQKVRLEVSGIFQGTSSDIAARLAEKLRQADTTNQQLQKLAIIVEYSGPEARVGQ